MYYVVEIDGVKNNFWTYRVTKKKPKQILDGDKTVSIIETSKSLLGAVKLMLNACSRNRDFMYIEDENYQYDELSHLVKMWENKINVGVELTTAQKIEQITAQWITNQMKVFKIKDSHQLSILANVSDESLKLALNGRKKLSSEMKSTLYWYFRLLNAQRQIRF